MGDLIKELEVGDIDPRLLQEAFRRAQVAPTNKDADPASLLTAILDEARRGTRHMHGLVGAAARARTAA